MASQYVQVPSPLPIIGPHMDDSRIIYYDPTVYATVQDAINAAEALAGSTDDVGVMVQMPLGDYSAQTVLIGKNVKIVGQGADDVQTHMGTLNYRPTSAVAGPTAAGLQNLIIDTVNLYAETGAASGIFYPDMLSAGLFATNCAISNITADRINNIFIRDSQVTGILQSFTLCEVVMCLNSKITSIDWHTNDAALHLPTSYSGGNPQFLNSYVYQMELTQDGGVVTSYVKSTNSFIETLIMNGNCDVRVEGGSVKNLTRLNSANGFLDYQSYAPYLTSNEAYWATSPPTSVNDALDRLAKAASSNGVTPIPL